VTLLYPWDLPAAGVGLTGPAAGDAARGLLIAALLPAGVAAGLTPIERCIALLAAVRDGRLLARPSFFQLQQVRKARALGVPMHLIAHEDVIVLAKPHPQSLAARKAAA
jgi:hypothetical protein